MGEDKSMCDKEGAEGLVWLSAKPLLLQVTINQSRTGRLVSVLGRLFSCTSYHP